MARLYRCVHMASIGCRLSLLAYVVRTIARLTFGNYATRLCGSKLTLQKLCWIRLAREVEGQIFGSHHGPFLSQKQFFDDLACQRLSKRDVLLFECVGSRRTRSIPLLLVVIAVTVAGFGFGR
jgi:hypothetical protein